MSLSLYEWAWELLETPSLEQKIFSPNSWTDPDFSAPPSLPKKPNRPTSLQLGGNVSKVPFPKSTDLELEKNRGYVFHFFANHELLALELMALMLLKFPEAPKAFRHGLACTIQEEQRHLNQYLKQMKAYGVTFGEIGVNDFFWKCLSSVDSPHEFVAGMSLTFEQANLDYCLYYQKAFEQVQDEDAVQLLQEVYEDEIGHVKHGLNWFQQWKDSTQTDWDAYQQALTFPLTPMRAKGKEVDLQGRQKAGLSDEFIKQLQLYSHSKGRTPNVYWMDLNCEQQQKAQAVASPLQQDLETLPLFLAHQDDVVCLSHKPSDAFLQSLLEAQFTIPEQVTSLDELAHRKLADLKPWGWGVPSFKHLKKYQAQLPDTKQPHYEKLSAGQPQKWFSKIWARQQLQAFFEQNTELLKASHWNADALGRVIESQEELYAYAHVLEKVGYQRIVLKTPWSAAGRERMWLNLPLAPDEADSAWRWTQKRLKSKTPLLVEPWWKRVFDFSVHFDVNVDGNTKCLGFVEFQNNAHGQYLGAKVGRFEKGVDGDILKFLNTAFQSSHKTPLLQFYQQLGSFCGKQLHQHGYWGPLGIDAFIYEMPQSNGEVSWKLHPMIEFNPRYTMGRVAWTLSKRMNLHHVGWWQLKTLKMIQEQGFASFKEYAASLSPGTILTNDPLQAQQVLGVLEIEEHSF